MTTEEQPEQNIDVSKIMDEVRRKVAQKRAAGIYPPAPEDAQKTQPSDAAAQETGTSDHIAKAAWSLGTMRAVAYIRLEGEPIHSHRPIAGFFLKKWKRFTRFWIRRYTDILFLQQSRYNTETANTIAEMQEEIKALRAEVDRLKNKQ